MKLRESDHPDGGPANNGDAELGNAANGRNGSSTSHPPLQFVSHRWGYLLLLCCVVVYMAYEVTSRSKIKLASVKGVMHGSKEGAYEPLVGRAGEMWDNKYNSSAYKETASYHESRDRAEPDVRGDGVNAPRPNGDELTPDQPIATGETGNNDGGSASAIQSNSSPPNDSGRSDLPPKADATHPRIACFMGEDVNTCNLSTTYALPLSAIDALPQPSENEKAAKKSGKGSGTTSDDVTDLYEGETEECKLSDPSYQALPAAPSTCNDVHALGFRFGPSERAPGSGINDVYPSRHSIKYLTSGGFRSVWTVNLLDPLREGHERAILKTNMLKRGWSSYYYDQNRRDVLISERAGGAPEGLFEGLTPVTGPNGKGAGANSNVLPVYGYCAFSSVVPFATAGVLDDFVYDRRREGNFLSAEEIYALAVMAARGLYQAQLYRGEKATHVHADVKPPQFLLFERPGTNAKNATAQSRFPVMQLNDFNRGKFLTRSKKTNATCPFQMCHVHHKGSLYRSPEEYMDCADQADTIDVYSLGGVFYYLMSDGKKPWYYVSSYKKGVARILDGEQPRLPNLEEYESYGEKAMARIRERSKHPAFVALQEVTAKCWAFEPEERPSSHEVVKMLEEKWRDIHASARKDSGLTRWMDKAS
ncbi:hypothetical protein ACHAXT_011316 [Thalassiosira profunda]